MTKRTKICLGLLFYLYSSATALQIDSVYQWQIGEDLTYGVSWGFIRLGTIQLSVVDTVQMMGQTTYHTKLIIDSNPWLFFINMHSQYDSYLLENTFPLLLICKEEIDDVEYNSRYEFDYQKQEIKVHYEGVEEPYEKIDKVIPLNNQIQDGMSIIFYARTHSNQKEHKQLSVFYEAREGILDINFTGNRDSIEAAFSDDPIPALYLNGSAHFTAIAGFNGNYEGWFSLDPQHIPLMARMEVFVGSVYIELEECKTWPTNPYAE